MPGADILQKNTLLTKSLISYILVPIKKPKGGNMGNVIDFAASKKEEPSSSNDAKPASWAMMLLSLSQSAVLIAGLKIFSLYDRLHKNLSAVYRRR